MRVDCGAAGARRDRRLVRRSGREEKVGVAVAGAGAGAIETAAATVRDPQIGTGQEEHHQGRGSWGPEAARSSNPSREAGSLWEADLGSVAIGSRLKRVSRAWMLPKGVQMS